ncbi:MAG TPA: VCBS repeat-containing protein [Thermoanaerobaculia bacterium]|nr:VCBS repeat-containing protein [Thermoanaerobaculia bacterium]
MRSIQLAPVLILLLASPGLSRELPFLAGTSAGNLTGAEAVVTGDLDGDGDLDLAAAGAAGDRVFWYEDTGAGFTRRLITDAWDEPVDLVLGDVDCDGDLDVVVAARGADSVVWLRNDGGTGAWPLGGTISSAATDVAAVALTDLGRDGDLDVLAAVPGTGEILRWRSDGCSGTVWNVATVATGLGDPQALALGDVNEDGRPDVVAALAADNEVAWFRNDGGSWTRFTIDGAFSAASAVSVGDVDGDGRLDVAAAAGTGHRVAWWGRDGGAWVKTTIGVVPSAVEARLADLDLDGDLDLLAASGQAPEPAHWWDNELGDGSDWGLRVLDDDPGSPRALAAFDHGRDGDVDVISAAAVGELRLYENASTGRSAYLGEVGSYPYLTAFRETPDWELGDLDGDGRPDLVLIDRDLSQPEAVVHWMRNLGASAAGYLAFGPTQPIDSFDTHAYEDLATGDLDGDGDVDVLIGETGSAGHGVTLCRNAGTGQAPWSCGLVVPGLWNVDGLGIGDLDGDGDLDVSAAAQTGLFSTEDAVWWQLDADAGTWTQQYVETGVNGLSELRPFDLDGDGDLDLVGNQDDWWRNDGGSPTNWTVRSVGATVVATNEVGDLDGDGDLDLAAATLSLGGPGLAWFENDLGGGGGWTEHEIKAPSLTTLYRDVALADLDVDGDLDLVVGQVLAGEEGLAWFENEVEVSGLPWAEQAIAPPLFLPASGAKVLTADLDRDGDADLLAGREELDFASWLNGGGQFALLATAVAPATLAPGQGAAVLAVDAWHRGLPGEAAMELSALALLFESSENTPLTPTELSALVAAVRLHHDDGSGTWEPGLDAEVAAFTSFTPADGVLVLGLADDLPALQHAPASTPQRYFVTVELAAGALGAGVLNPRVIHLPAAGAAAEQADLDLPLTREAAPPVVASFEVVGTDLFADGFESGDTSAWSLVFP